PKQLKLFEKERPGDSVQIDVKVVVRGRSKWFQYTAIDDCTRVRILRLYRRQNHHSSLAFLREVTTAFPFQIRKIQVEQRHRVPAPLRADVSEPRRPGPLYPTEAPATERQSRTQPSHRRRRIKGTLCRPGLRCGPRGPRRAGAPAQPRTLLNGAAWSHADGE